MSATVDSDMTSRTAVLDDQYISTGGQMASLMAGHDRFCCDLRPLLQQIVKNTSAQKIPEMTCHPYDAAGLLAATHAGVIITDGWGRRLDAPLNVEHPVHWCGYANSSLRELIQPVMHAWLLEHGLRPHPPNRATPKEQ